MRFMTKSKRRANIFNLIFILFFRFGFSIFIECVFRTQNIDRFVFVFFVSYAFTSRSSFYPTKWPHTKGSQDFSALQKKTEKREISRFSSPLQSLPFAFIIHLPLVSFAFRWPLRLHFFHSKNIMQTDTRRSRVLREMFATHTRCVIFLTTPAAAVGDKGPQKSGFSPLRCLVSNTKNCNTR